MNLLFKYTHYWNYDKGYYSYKLWTPKGVIKNKIQIVEYTVLAKVLIQAMNDFYDMAIDVQGCTIDSINAVLKERNLHMNIMNDSSRTKLISISDNELEFVDE